MMWLKRNFLALFVSLLFLGLIVGCVYWLLLTQRHQRSVQQEFETRKAEYERLIGNTVAPTRNNVDTLETQTEQLDDYYQKLLGMHPRGIKEYPTMQPWVFKGHLVSQLDRLNRYCEQNQVAVPVGMTFGFGRYSANKAPPKQEVTAKLLHQLDLAERIIKLLVESRVAEIRSLKRTFIDVEGEGADPERVSGGVWKQDPNFVFESQVFEVEFRSTFDQFRTALNNFCRSTNLVILVRNVNVDTELANPVEPQQATPTAPAGGPAAAAAMTPPGRGFPPAVDPRMAPGGRGRGTSPASRAPTINTNVPVGAEIVMGNESSTVTLRLECIEIKAEADGPKQTGHEGAEKKPGT